MPCGSRNMLSNKIIFFLNFKKTLLFSWQVILTLHRWGYVKFDNILIVYSNCLYKFKNAQRKSTEFPYFFFEHS